VHVYKYDSLRARVHQDHINKNLINFRGGDIEESYSEAVKRGLAFVKPARIESDGSWSAEIHDPDGNVIYFNTYQDEREKYLQTGKLIDYP